MVSGVKSAGARHGDRLLKSGASAYHAGMEFEWDPDKAVHNLAKHGVSFENAVTVFLDPDALDGPDLQHSSAESRFLRLGRSASGRVLMVACIFRRSGNAEAIRIISARRASRSTSSLSSR